MGMTVAPPNISVDAISSFAQMMLLVADTNRSGLISFSEFLSWKGRDTIVSWLDQHYNRLLQAYASSSVAQMPRSPTQSSKGPWTNLATLTTRELIRVFTSETWD